MTRKPVASTVFAALAALMTLTSCGGESVQPIPTPPNILLSTTGIVLAGKQNGDSVTQTFSVQSDGAPVAWSAASTSSWITVRPSSGTTPSTVTLVARPAGLAPGRAHGVVVVTTGAATATKEISVDLDVAALPTLSVSSTSLNFSGATQATLPPQQVSLTLSDPAVAWTASTPQTWISVSPASGKGSGLVSVSVNPTGLGVGTYNGTVTIAAAGTTGSPQNVNVTLVIPQRFSISVSASPSELGTVSGGGAYAAGETATITATPNAGAEFVNWTDGRVEVSTARTFSFFVSQTKAFVANFRGPLPATITTSANPTNGGTTTGGGSYAGGASVTVTATPTFGYTFINWTEGSTVVSTTPTYTFNADGNRALVANFVNGSASTVSIITGVNPGGAGTASGSGTVTVGATTSVTAIANTGWAFSSWTENGVVVSTSSPYTFTVTAQRILIANFLSTAASNWTILANTAPTNGGLVAGSGAYGAGDPVTLTATANPGYTFSGWSENGSVISTSATLTFTATANRLLVATFAPIP